MYNDTTNVIIRRHPSMVYCKSMNLIGSVIIDYLPINNDGLSSVLKKGNFVGILVQTLPRIVIFLSLSV